MSDILKTLQPAFANKVQELLDRAHSRLAGTKPGGYELRPYFGLRSAQQQARFWRQSRPTAQIVQTAEWLEEQGASWLASVLLRVGPQQGRWATNALPGTSWHNWGLAVDCFVLDVSSRRAIWEAGHIGYRVYAEEAQAMGLSAGYYWRVRDSVHVQATGGRIQDRKTWPEIDAEMKTLFDKEN